MSEEPPPEGGDQDADAHARRLPNGDAAAAPDLPRRKSQPVVGVRVVPSPAELQPKSSGTQQASQIPGLNVVAVPPLKSKFEALRVAASTPGAFNGS